MTRLQNMFFLVICVKPPRVSPQLYKNIIAKLFGHKILILVACRTDKKVIKNSDLMVAYRTLPGEPSPRDKATRTPFVQNMLKLLSESRSQDMLTLFQRLGVEMDKIGTSTETQIRGSTKKNYIR
jgi:hypothetical protein